MPHQEGTVVGFTPASGLTGYTFTGWSPAAITADMTGAQSVTVGWRANAYQIAYYANGGSGTMTATDCEYDKEGAIAANGFTHSGYVFKGWATEENGEVVYRSGEKVKIVSDGSDIAEFLDVPAVDGNGMIDLTKATVKEEIVKEVLDIEKAAVIDLLGGSQGTASPTITTAPTRVGLFYQLREGETLDEMVDGDSKVGDGQPWTPEITVKGGASAFYSIGVGKGE